MDGGHPECDYDVIVVGCGGVGSGALYWLAKTAPEGKILGLEQFQLGHDNGGSQDWSRIIRLLYHKECYTKLARHTYDAWRTVERESGIQLLYETGGLELVDRNSGKLHVLENYAEAMDQQAVRYERLTPEEVRRRWPQMKIPDVELALYEPTSGLVDAALGNSVHVQLARARGVTVLQRCAVTAMRTRADGSVVVSTPLGNFRGRRVVVTAGAWINDVISHVGAHIPVTVTQENVSYLSTKNPACFTKDKFPVFIHHGAQCDYYGLPIHGNSFTKVGMDAEGSRVTAQTRTFAPDPERERRCREYLQKNIPEMDGEVMQTRTCLYTMPHDRDFVVDTLGRFGHENVIVCCGAGHAFKWASFLGKVLAEMALLGRSSYDIGAFSMDRPAVQDPNFQRNWYMGSKSKL